MTSKGHERSRRIGRRKTQLRLRVHLYIPSLLLTWTSCHSVFIVAVTHQGLGTCSGLFCGVVWVGWGGFDEVSWEWWYALVSFWSSLAKANPAALFNKIDFFFFQCHRKKKLSLTTVDIFCVYIVKAILLLKWEENSPSTKKYAVRDS